MAKDENELWPIIKSICEVSWRVEGVLQKGHPDVLAVFESKYITIEMKDVECGSPLGLLPEQIAWCRKTGRAKAPHFIAWIYRDAVFRPRVNILSVWRLHAMFSDERHFTRTLADDTTLPENPDAWVRGRAGSFETAQIVGPLKAKDGMSPLQLSRSISRRL